MLKAVHFILETIGILTIAAVFVLAWLGKSIELENNKRG